MMILNIIYQFHDNSTVSIRITARTNGHRDRRIEEQTFSWAERRKDG